MGLGNFLSALFQAAKQEPLTILPWIVAALAILLLRLIKGLESERFAPSGRLYAWLGYARGMLWVLVVLSFLGFFIGVQRSCQEDYQKQQDWLFDNTKQQQVDDLLEGEE
jgi:hypothetical protein